MSDALISAVCCLLLLRIADVMNQLLTIGVRHTGSVLRLPRHRLRRSDDRADARQETAPPADYGGSSLVQRPRNVFNVALAQHFP